MLEFNKQELAILEFWEKNGIFNKLREKNKGKKKWSFIDGPITANNPMGVHHAWGRTYKDVFQRFKAMQGFDQRYQNGFDCQGLWVEREEEKDLGLKNKKDIENFGILNFVQACRKRVEKYSQIQKNQSIRLGQWMDWENRYYTMTDNNNLHNWMLLKLYHDKGWLYKGKDAVPWCPRCGTASSKHDIATEGYKEVTHTALYMQFPLKGKDNEYFLIFTTTPWTVPANVAIAVNPDITYVLVDNEGVKYWLAESRLSELIGKYSIVGRKIGKELKGVEYIMPYAHFSEQKNAPHKVVLWELASGDDGTGIVHIAPGCGAEDFDLGVVEKLPSISPLDEAGIYRSGFEEFSLKFYKGVNKEVLADLEQRRFVYKTVPIKHRYPHCWRCGEELVFRLVDEWYIKAEEMRKILIRENKKVTWFPEYGKARQEEWFKNMGDWLISRKRYWGLPLPIWECSCGHVEVIGSIEELKEKAIDKKKVDSLPELHRPWVDEIKIRCSKCKKDMERVKDVGDAWLDAGIVPFSTLNYLQDRKYWDEWFPADFICENMPGQFRGWFNALFWSSGAITGKTPFKSVLAFETLKDEKGNEMHKSKGNAIWFDEAAEKMGADSMRLLYCLQDPAQELKFGYTTLKEPQMSLNILYNLSKLITPIQSKSKTFDQVEDRWIISKLNTLVKSVTEELTLLHPHQAIRDLQQFWLVDFSRGYVQMVRDRIGENDEDVQTILRQVYLTLIKLTAPFVPFLTEMIWQDLREKKIVEEESIHLCEWPKSQPRKINSALEEQFFVALKIIEAGLAERDKLKIGLKWPLASAKGVCGVNLSSDFNDLIKRQLNVKKVTLSVGNAVSVTFDTKMTPELEGEGFVRELARNVQVARKKAGLQKEDFITLKVYVPATSKKILLPQTEFFKERVNAKTLDFIDDKIPSDAAIFTIKNIDFGVMFTLLLPHQANK